MNLSEFVEESLSEILTGIRAAQNRDGGGAVGAGYHIGPSGHGNLFNGGMSDASFTTVDFDVSVGAETTAGGKAGIRVMSIGAEGGGERKSHESSRIKFSVQLRIPTGDPIKKPKGFE